MSFEEREDLAVFVALAEYMRRRALEIVERSSAGAPRRALREAVTAAAHALRVALEDVERWAGP